jgi:Uma2 family endonuclease
METRMADAIAEPAASAEAPAPPMTADELLRLPTGMGRRYELIEGELKIMSPAGSRHGLIALRLGGRLDRFVQERRLGAAFAAETGFILARDPDTVRAPDAAFVSAARIPPTGLPEGYFPGAPDLAVEVISPGDTAAEVAGKTNDYFEAGTRQVWLVYPDLRQVAVFASARESRILAVDDTLDGGDLLPGFTCPVAEIFD